MLALAGCEHPGSKRAAPPVKPRPARENQSLALLWELDRSKVTPHTGAGGLDPARRVPDELLKLGIETNGYLPPNPVFQNGLYFNGPGRILPECAMRISSAGQVRNATSQKRQPETYRNRFWTGPDDCSGLAWIVRDERDLIITVDVRDDMFNALPAESAFLVSDAVELFLDIRRGDRGKAAFEKGVVHMLLVPQRSGRVYVRFGAVEQKIAGVFAHAGMLRDGYRIFIRIPLQELSWKHGFLGSEFNFDWAIRDSDTMGELDTLMVWSGDEHNAHDARLFGRMRALRRGYYLAGTASSGSGPPDGRAILSTATRFHVRGGGPGGGTWDGREDCSAVCWVRRGDDRFDVTIDVRDDVLEVSAVNPWERDGVELFFDVRPDDERGRSSYAKGVFQLICAAAAEDGTLTPRFGGDPMLTSVPRVSVTFKRTARGYRIDVGIPFKGLEENHMAPGEQFNFDFIVNDADSPRGRDTILAWSGDGNNWQNATAFGRMSPLPEQGP